MKSIFCYVLLLLTTTATSLYAQKKKAKISIINSKQIMIILQYVPEAYFAYKKHPDTISKLITDTSTLKIYLTGEKGACTFNIIDKQSHILIKGTFLDAPVLEKLIVLRINGETGDREGQTIMHVYHPIPDGEWIYYTPQGEILKKEKYVNGILQNEPK